MPLGPGWHAEFMFSKGLVGRASRFVHALCLAATGRTISAQLSSLPLRGQTTLPPLGSMGVRIFEKGQARQKSSWWCINLALPHHNTILGSACLRFNREPVCARPSKQKAGPGESL